MKQNSEAHKIIKRAVDQPETTGDRGSDWHPENWDPAKWHPVRLPEKAPRRWGKATPLNAFSASGTTEMQGWLTVNCRGQWRQEYMADGRSTFWFEDNEDAIGFALRWFPYRSL